MKEFRIYIDGELKNVCHNEYALMCNVTSYKATFGADRVTVKELENVTNDEEKRRWLERL